MVRKMGAQLKRTNIRLNTVEENVEVAVSCISDLLEKVKSMKEEMKALERTRSEILQNMEEMEERAILEESFEEEFRGTDNEVQPIWAMEEEVKEKQETVEQEESIKEDAAGEEQELEVGEEIQVGRQRKDVSDMEVTD